MVHRSLFYIAILAFQAVGPSARAGLVIPQWRLGVTVYDSSSGQQETSILAAPQNPFQASHSVNVGISTSESVYTFDWSANAGSFLTEAAHQAEDIDDGYLESRSTGFIWVEPSIEGVDDLRVEISASYDYYLPPGMMLALLKVVVSDSVTGDHLFYERLQVDSFDGFPASGTLNIAGSTILPYDHTAVLIYELTIQSFSGQTGLLGTGNGFVDFQITPEPAALSLLALAAAPLLLPRPRRRRPRRR